MFTFEPSTTSLMNEMISHPEAGKTARAPVDRRMATAGDPAAPVQHKRRRDDNLNRPKRSPLEW